MFLGSFKKNNLASSLQTFLYHRKPHFPVVKDLFSFYESVLFLPYLRFVISRDEGVFRLLS